MLEPHGKCRLHPHADLVMPNRYYGWYVNTGDLVAAEIDMREELARWANEGEAHHHDRVRRRHLSGEHDPACRTERGLPGRLPEANCRAMDATDLVVGEQMWNFADFATSSASCEWAWKQRAPHP